MEWNADELWGRILENAREVLPEPSYRTWLAPTEAIALAHDHLVVAAPSQFAADWIEDKYGAILKRLAESVLGRPFALQFQHHANGAQPTHPPPIPEVEAPTAAPPDVARTQCVVGQLNERYTFERFVVGTSNQLSAAACRAVANSPGNAYNPLFIYGGVGLGKTHLMHAIGHAVPAREPGRRVAYVPSEHFTNELIGAIQGRATAQFRRRYRQVDVLLVDDVHFLADKEGTQEEFFHTFNDLYGAQRQIVITSDRPPKEIPGLQERLVSRFHWGLVVDIKAPDLETRVAILQKKAEEDHLVLAAEVLEFIARHCRSSVRELEGAVIKLLAYSSLTRREVTVELAREALEGMVGTGTLEQGRLTAERVREAVAEAFGVPVDGLVSGRRARHLALPRQVAMYLIKQLLDLTYVEIGELFGGRDHSTVIHSVTKIQELAAQDSHLRARLDAIRSALI
ncbi:MAG: chromosomal replication initiator protein DnaA [Gemmatimonadetes bacterium]|nr:chromosomal replication initiator protein DnaA [Gemmatimonadota bacterium]